MSSTPTGKYIGYTIAVLLIIGSIGYFVSRHGSSSKSHYSNEKDEEIAKAEIAKAEETAKAEEIEKLQKKLEASQNAQFLDKNVYQNPSVVYTPEYVDYLTDPTCLYGNCGWGWGGYGGGSGWYGPYGGAYGGRGHHGGGGHHGGRGGGGRGGGGGGGRGGGGGGGRGGGGGGHGGRR